MTSNLLLNREKLMLIGVQEFWNNYSFATHVTGWLSSFFCTLSSFNSNRLLRCGCETDIWSKLLGLLTDETQGKTSLVPHSEALCHSPVPLSSLTFHYETSYLPWGGPSHDDTSAFQPVFLMWFDILLLWSPRVYDVSACLYDDFDALFLP